MCDPTWETLLLPRNRLAAEVCMAVKEFPRVAGSRSSLGVREISPIVLACSWGPKHDRPNRWLETDLQRLCNPPL